MAKKMSGRLVALSASAVATIYLAGLLSSQPAAQSVAVASTLDSTAAVASPSSSAATTTADPTSTSMVVVGASATATPVATSTTSTSTTSSTYADGTYSATGTSRLGNVSVSVTISGGKVSNVQITSASTNFPVSQIASLPAQVIASQSANVNVVTGATYSSQAFKQAVQAALSQALAASSTTASG